MVPNWVGETKTVNCGQYEVKKITEIIPRFKPIVLEAQKELDVHIWTGKNTFWKVYFILLNFGLSRLGDVILNANCVGNAFGTRKSQNS